MTARRSTALVLAALVVGVGSVAAAALLLRGGTARAPETGAGGARTAPGAPAPAVAGTDVRTGERVSLADFDGKPLVVSIWASWCSDCAAYGRALGRFARAHREAALLGIDVQDTPEDAAAFYRRFGWRHPSIFDPEGRQAAKLELDALPLTLFLNADHVVVSRIAGVPEPEELEAAYAEIAAAGP